MFTFSGLTVGIITGVCYIYEKYIFFHLLLHKFNSWTECYGGSSIGWDKCHALQ